MSGLYQIFLAGMNPPNRPIGTMLFLGPTGSGKTRVIEAAAEVLFGDPNAVVKIDCAEFQHSHEIAKLIGSPPGYLGHRETSPMLTQENLDRMHTDDMKLSLVLFDEIEKASDQSVAAAARHSRQSDADAGRQPPRRFLEVDGHHDFEPRRARDVGTDFRRHRFRAGQRREEPERHRSRSEDLPHGCRSGETKFSPEFMNRIDKVVVFRSLKEHHLRQILDLELQAVQDRIMQSAGTKFVFQCSDEAKEMLLEGRHRFQIRRAPLETSGRTFPRLSAFEPGGDRTDRTGRSGAR